VPRRCSSCVDLPQRVSLSSDFGFEASLKHQFPEETLDLSVATSRVLVMEDILLPALRRRLVEPACVPESLVLGTEVHATYARPSISICSLEEVSRLPSLACSAEMHDP
jgi:hypothetical protein